MRQHLPTDWGNKLVGISTDAMAKSVVALFDDTELPDVLKQGLEVFSDFQSFCVIRKEQTKVQQRCHDAWSPVTKLN